MSKRIRILNPNKHQLTGSRTQQERLLMRPCPQANEIIGGVIARYQEIHEVEIYAVVFLSNHCHTLCKASKGNLWRFQMDVKREIARRINKHLGRRGKFWSERYSSFEVIDEYSDALEALLYLVTNPVHHGLIHHPKHWPGVNSYWQLLTGKKQKFRFTHWSSYSAAKKKADRRGDFVKVEDHQTTHSIRLSVLPQIAHLSVDEQREFLVRKIENRVAKIKSERVKEGRGFLTRKQLLAQSPFEMPRSVKRSRKPPCYTKSLEARRSYLEVFFIIQRWYREASCQFRNGNLQIEFPPYTFRPPLLFP